ncbi:sirohydrochlorin chelatase [Simplicispira lacusdiani]|uniref:sirohydrochlorin chelatase n=1 Tax=Simplicispira lacusdiani TaxID=2213010 RepID=UPI000E710EB7|nr:CbiX/SirB N-terminal domain-containing protein [Simplicispira lacusdiani]
MTTLPHTTGIVLFAHGSRDPLWRAPIEAVQNHILAHHPGVAVRCAYLELSTPDLPQAVQELVDQRALGITIVPMFLGTGKHARADLPVLVDGLRAQHPAVQFTVQGAIGEDPRMTALMAAIACSAPLGVTPT